MAKESYYFAHDYGARNDPKLINLQIKHGMFGVGVYWCIVEMLYEQGGYFKYNLNELKFILRTDAKKIESIINDFNLFKIEDGNLYSDTILRRLQIRDEKSGKAKESAFNKWGSDPSNAQKRSERLSMARSIATHTKEDWNDMLLFFKNTCVKCGSKEFIVKDHIVPIYQGGSDGITNLQPLCRTCNSSKGSENIDFRSDYCSKNACEMPPNYIEMPAIKERKEKEINENKEMSNFDLFFDLLYNDTNWLELVLDAERRLFAVEDVKANFKTFYTWRKMQGDYNPKEIKEVKSYFGNWLKKADVKPINARLEYAYPVPKKQQQ